MFEETNAPLVFVAAASAELPRARPFVAIVRTREELQHWLDAPPRGVEWLQVEGLLGDVEAWACAAQGATAIPLDVIVERPAEEYSLLYRLADVRLVRDVRVTLLAVPGFLKAVQLAASMQLPVRLLPGQPSEAVVDELIQAVDFYLHNEFVDAPVEFFHSILTLLRPRAGDQGAGASAVTLWQILEQDPALFLQLDSDGRPLLPGDFLIQHQKSVLEGHAECATCEWQHVCAGYFKWPVSDYSCTSIHRVFAHLAAAAEEIERDLAAVESARC